MLRLYPLTLTFAFTLLFLNNVSASPTKDKTLSTLKRKPSPKENSAKILSSSEWGSIESMEEKGEPIIKLLELQVEMIDPKIHSALKGLFTNFFSIVQISYFR